jgi:hypothetical protein
MGSLLQELADLRIRKKAARLRTKEEGRRSKDQK